jgi:hypothetical protein
VKSGYLDRIEDVSGVSGTGKISEFAISSDGRVVVFWASGYSIFPSLEEAVKTHGHNGKTKFVILTDSEAEHCLGCHANLSDEGCEHHSFGCPACLTEASS